MKVHTQVINQTVIVNVIRNCLLRTMKTITILQLLHRFLKKSRKNHPNKNNLHPVTCIQYTLGVGRVVKWVPHCVIFGKLASLQFHQNSIKICLLLYSSKFVGHFFKWWHQHFHCAPISISTSLAWSFRLCLCLLRYISGPKFLDFESLFLLVEE